MQATDWYRNLAAIGRGSQAKSAYEPLVPASTR